MLFADILNLIGSLVGLALLVLWVVRQIMDANKQAPPARGRQRGAPPRPVPGGGVQQAGQQADPLRNQVEEFLRRAGRAPQANQPARERRMQPAGAGDVELLVGEELTPIESPSAAEPLRPVEAHASPMPPPVIPPGTKPAKERRQRRPGEQRKRETLAERAAQREGARARRLAQQAAQLGQRIIQEDHQFDVQLQAKFDHSVGTLTSAATTVVEQRVADSDSPAAQIAVMLASPEGVRQAVILNEILRRPSDRW